MTSLTCCLERFYSKTQNIGENFLKEILLQIFFALFQNLAINFARGRKTCVFEIVLASWIKGLAQTFFPPKLKYFIKALI